MLYLHQERIERIRKMRKKGYPIYLLAQRLGISMAEVKLYLEKIRKKDEGI